MAEAVNVGPDVKTVKSKDKIVYKAYAMDEIKLNYNKYVVISEDDILGVLVDV